MHFRRRESQAIEAGNRMTSMIDVVFLLLIFFVLTLKVIEPEGDLAVQKTPDAGPGLPPINNVRVRLIANEDGSLQRLLLGQADLGGGDPAFGRLNHRILLLIGRPGSELAKDLTVEIVADQHLHYGHTVRAISACSGRRDPRTGNIVRYVEKIRFGHPPGTGA